MPAKRHGILGNQWADAFAGKRHPDRLPYLCRLLCCGLPDSSNLLNSFNEKLEGHPA